MSDPTNARAYSPSPLNGTPPSPKPAATQQPAALLAALDYLERGWSPIPLCDPQHCDPVPYAHRKTCKDDRRGKLPLGPWKHYCTTPATRALVLEWWKQWPHANVGICLGPVSKLVAWDIDGPEGWDLLVQLLGCNPPDTLEFQTPGGGRRLLYRWDSSEKIPTRVFPTNRRPLTFQGHGSQTVMPPSVHRNGGVYTWPQEGRPGQVEIAPVTGRMIDVAQRWRAEQRRTGLVGRRAPRAAGPSLDRMGRAQRYCEACPPAIAGQGGDLQTWKVARGLVRSLGLNYEDTLYALVHFYNPRCQPPWPEAMLQHKAFLAVAQAGTGLTTIGEVPSIGPAVQQVLDRFSPGLSDNRLSPPVTPDSQRPIAGKIGPKDKKDIETNRISNISLSSSPLSSPPPPPEPDPFVEAHDVKKEVASYLLDPWIPRGQLTLVTGAPEIGKSHFAMHVMSSARKALLFPGREENLSLVIHQRLRAAGIPRGRVLVFTGDGWLFPGSRARLTDQVVKEGADLVVFDPAASYLADGLSEDANQAIRCFLESLAGVASDTGAAVVGIHHPGKAAGNLLRGATNWLAVARCVLNLARDPGDPSRSILSAVKFSVGPKPAPRFFRLEGREGGGCVFTLHEEVDESVAAISAEHGTPAGQRKLDMAKQLLQQLLAEERQDAVLCLKRGEDLGISKWVMHEARVALKIPTKREGFGANAKYFWGPIPKEAPPA